MSKPTDLPRWSTAETNDTEPTSGEKDSGIVSGAAGNSSIINWLLRTTYEWLAFLDPIFTSAGGILVPTDQSVKLQGTGRYKHPSQTITIPGSAFIGTDFDTECSRGDTVLINNHASVPKGFYFPLIMQPGKRVTAITAKILTSANAGTRRLFVEYGNGDTTSTPVGTAPSSGSTSTTITLSYTGLPHTILAKPYEIQPVLVNGDILIECVVTFDDL